MKNSVSKLVDLSGKVAIVTGGAMGIGKGIAFKFAEAGASVLIVDKVSKNEAKDTLDQLKQSGAKIEYLQVDLLVTSLLSSVINKALNTFGDLHILVNNAGIFKYSPVTELSEELWDNTLNLNLKAVAFLSKLAVNTMVLKKHGGRIINISSADSIKPTGSLSIYDASKGGVKMLTKAFAKEVGKYGINVNDIAPGGVNTPGALKIAFKNPTKEQLQISKEQTEKFAKSLPLQRMGEPEDIGNAALFLASDAASYITGSTIVVDGGLLLM